MASCNNTPSTDASASTKNSTQTLMEIIETFTVESLKDQLSGVNKERANKFIVMFETFLETRKVDPEVTSNLQEMIAAKKDLWKLFKIAKRHHVHSKVQLRKAVVEKYGHADKDFDDVFEVPELQPHLRLCSSHSWTAENLYRKIHILEFCMKRIWKYESGAADLDDNQLTPQELDWLEWYQDQEKMRDQLIMADKLGKEQDKLRKQLQDLQDEQEEERTSIQDQIDDLEHRQEQYWEGFGSLVKEGK